MLWYSVNLSLPELAMDLKGKYRTKPMCQHSTMVVIEVLLQYCKPSYTCAKYKAATSVCLSDCTTQEIWTQGGFHLLYSHVMFLSLGSKQGTRFWSQELYLGVIHSRMPTNLKMTYTYMCVHGNEKWKDEEKLFVIKLLSTESSSKDQRPPWIFCYCQQESELMSSKLKS